jgi:hypothetical protein
VHVLQAISDSTSSGKHRGGKQPFDKPPPVASLGCALDGSAGVHRRVI